MRILFLSNFYPPIRPGGYTQWCHEVAESLRAKGHTIGVLTSSHQLDKANIEEEGIYRLLHLEGDLEYYRPGDFFLNYRRRQRENAVSLKQIIKEFNPEVLFIWGMWSLSKALPALAEQIMPSRVVYYVSDHWPLAKDRHTEYWKSPPQHGYLRGLKKLLNYYALSIVAKDTDPQLQLEHVITVSEAVMDRLRAADLPLRNACVIHGGTDIGRFADSIERDFASRPLKLLYAGQLEEHKGVHTAIQAVGHLVSVNKTKQIKLTIAGSGHQEYMRTLKAMVNNAKLENHIEFVGQMPKDKMPALLQEHAILVFPSIYEEPFARMIQEAMLSGMVVVGTPTGGTKEIIVDGENGLLFFPGDAFDLSKRLCALIEDPQLCGRLAERGRKTVMTNFTLNEMVNKIERYLTDVVKITPRKTHEDTFLI